MIEKKTVLNRGEIDFENHIIGIRFAKIIVDGGKELARGWHRISIDPGSDLDIAMTSVNEHLAGMGAAAVESAEIDRLRALLPSIFTDEVKTEFAAKLDSNILP